MSIELKKKKKKFGSIYLLGQFEKKRKKKKETAQSCSNRTTKRISYKTMEDIGKSRNMFINQTCGDAI